VIIDNLIRHDILASNHLLGDSLFLTLLLPGNWEIASGVSRPEISASHERRNRLWVANGQGWYVLFDKQRRWALEMAIQIKAIHPNKISSDIIHDKPGERMVRVSDHRGLLKYSTRKRGLPWRRHDVKYMNVIFSCPYSERRIKLEFSGWCPGEGFDEILEVLEFLRCH
jgi:hypothetical protein